MSKMAIAEECSCARATRACDGHDDDEEEDEEESRGWTAISVEAPQ